MLYYIVILKKRGVGLLITKEVDLIVNGKNRKHLEQKGYIIPKSLDNRGRMRTPRGTTIKVKVEDLSLGSHTRVIVKCDYCGAIKNISYKDYIKCHDEELGDCCHRCEYIKYQRTMIAKYGIDNPNFVPEIKNKVLETNRKKYGYDYHMQRPEYQQYYELLMQDRYGVKRPLQYEEFKNKFITTISEKAIFTSKPQKEVFFILCNLYPQKCFLEYPYRGYLLDCFVDFGDVKIDVEYDGMFWHQLNEEHDKTRDKVLIHMGYKILRIKWNKKDDIPTKEQIQHTIETLVNSSKNYIEITM